MNKTVKVIRVFYQADWKKRLLLIRLVFIVIKISILVRYTPLRKYYDRYPKHKDIPNYLPEQYIKDITLIRKLFSYIPWQLSCLMQCLIVKEYFLHHNIYITVKIGVKTEGGIKAHAWYNEVNRNGFVEILCI